MSAPGYERGGKIFLTARAAGDSASSRARRKMRLNDLADGVDITPQNLSVLKTGKAKAIRFIHPPIFLSVCIRVHPW